MKIISMMKVMGAAAIVASVACGSVAANISGNYSVNVTNGDNGCNIPNWTVGAMSTNIPFTITQTGGNATGTLNGAVGAYASLVLGSNTFTGTVLGEAFDLKLFGTKSYTMNSCAYTVNAEVSGTINGNFIGGSIVYTPSTNGSPDCGTLNGCQSQQTFNGARPQQ